jgi:Leucine-rich repeat (LRR) protein
MTFKDYLRIHKVDTSYCGLDCSGMNLTDLDGIEVFTNLISLNCSNNHIMHIPYIEGLEILDCSQNYITDLIEFPVSLYSITCSKNRIRKLPNLDKLINLDFLDCSNNYLTELPSLYNNTKLRRLFCQKNQLRSLTDLRNNKMLCHIECKKNIFNYSNEKIKVIRLYQRN